MLLGYAKITPKFVCGLQSLQQNLPVGGKPVHIGRLVCGLQRSEDLASELWKMA